MWYRKIHHHHHLVSVLTLWSNYSHFHTVSLIVVEQPSGWRLQDLFLPSKLPQRTFLQSPPRFWHGGIRTSSIVLTAHFKNPCQCFSAYPLLWLAIPGICLAYLPGQIRGWPGLKPKGGGVLNKGQRNWVKRGRYQISMIVWSAQIWWHNAQL